MYNYESFMSNLDPFQVATNTLDENLYKMMNLKGSSNNNMPNNIDFKETKNMAMPSLFTPAVAYDNGNLFTNLYQQYRNYQPVNLTPRSDKDRLLLELNRFAFAAHELNLYLDVHPNDNSMITLFNDYREKADKLEREFEKKYGPLSIDSNSLNQSPFVWEKDVWPWEESYYV